MKEFSKSEMITCNRNRENREKQSHRIMHEIIMNQMAETKAVERASREGSSRFKGVGIDDRISARPYDFARINPLTASDGTTPLTKDELSYYYGYIHVGNEKIALQIKHPEIQRQAQIRDVATADALGGKIDFSQLPQIIRENEEYKAGFAYGLTMRDQKPKKR